VRWIAHAATPSTSTYAALNTLPEDQAVLITTADHALLTSEIVDYFCAEARRTGCDLAFALAPHDLVDAAHPGVRRTVLKFRDGGYCSCNLFAFMTARSREAANYWRQVERDRKHPWKIARTLGWLTVLRYALGRLSLGDVQKLASRQLGVQVGAVVMPFPQAAIDVDTVADWEYVKAVSEAAQQKAGANPQA
jgi:CTP:molybdopterin cytidylyltransferase MocA